MKRIWTIAFICFFCLMACLCALPIFAQNIPSKKTTFKPRLILPVQYFVVIQGPKSKFLSHYCRSTKTGLKYKKGLREAGPFMSAYEAGWLASRIPHARVERKTLFSRAKEPMDIDRLTDILGEQYNLDDAKILETGWMKINNQTLMKVYLEFKDKQTYEALFLENETQLFKVIEQPWLDDPYQESFGIGVITTEDDLIFLSLENAERGTESKTENMHAWRFNSFGEKIPIKLFEGFTEFGCIWDAKHQGYVDFRCSRIKMAKDSMQMRHYNMHLRSSGFDPDQSLKSATSWQIKGPDKDALKVKRIHWPVKEVWKWEGS
ncbi:MAG: hypothetical protein EHM45_04625 [Desulfobacteraceae bacterium]|nr:MAG: hypothetical protein EHM45_04625 [Desulfobacteraceae bacterium]